MIKHIFHTFVRKVKEKLARIKSSQTFKLGLWDTYRLVFYPPRKNTTAQLLGKRIVINDARWHLPTYREIWEDQIYIFETSNPSPLIIDCGANIGLSVIYWKYLFPESKVVAFEPDQKKYEILCGNIALLT
jgi:hypothetical protein